MSTNNSSPLDHLLAYTLAFTGGVIVTLVWRGYGLYMRHLGRHEAQARHDKERQQQAHPHSAEEDAQEIIQQRLP